MKPLPDVRREPRPLRVIFLEASEEGAATLSAALRQGGHEVTGQRVDTLAGLREVLSAPASAAEDYPWDLVLAEQAVSGLDPQAALAVLRELGLDLPFILLSESEGGVPDGISRSGLAGLIPAVQRELREAATRSEQRRLQEQLLVAERMASVGTLAAGVAHEINNPLAAVVANLELALRTVERLPPELSDLAELRAELRDAHEAAHHVRQIVRDVKVFSRPVDERPRPVDVRQVLDSTVRMAWNEIRHRAKLHKTYDQVPPVWTTDARLGQVFLNLLINAAQAIEIGHVDSNHIQLATRTDERGRAVVEIADTGVGISHENLNRIFTPFFTTKPPGGGTGLGLSISHRIVKELGGELRLTSEPGRGTTATVCLPAAHTRPPAP